MLEGLNQKLEACKKYSIPVLRYGLVAVFLYFGINQLINPDNFVGYLPLFIFNSSYAKIFVIANGAFEVVAATLLIVGYFTRFVALILALHLLAITIEVGVGEVGARDFALSAATFALFLNGPDQWCLDTKLKNKMVGK